MISALARALQRVYRKVKKRFSSNQSQLDTLYRLLYNLAHDNEQAIDLAANQTEMAFGKQWQVHGKGGAMLTNKTFRDSLPDIIVNQEVQLKKEWFEGKEVLDAGCGNGRWAYGYAKLGVKLTCVDINGSALQTTQENLGDLADGVTFHKSPLEEVIKVMPNRQFDLVHSWGVLHHTMSFNKSLDQLCQLVKDGGVMHLYLYGRESKSYEDDVELFKQRLRYNMLQTEEEKIDFLLKKAKGDKSRVNAMHDYYAPLINRRLDYPYVRDFLQKRGFKRVERTKDHPELYIRAIKGDSSQVEPFILPMAQPPYWFNQFWKRSQLILKQPMNKENT